jgi:hypothetical protein
MLDLDNGQYRGEVCPETLVWGGPGPPRGLSPIITLGALLCSPVPRVTTTRVSITLGNFQCRLI